MTEPSSPPQKQIRSFVPWILGLCVLAMVVTLGYAVTEKKTRLEESHKRELTSDASAVRVILQQLVPVTLEDAFDLPGIIHAWEEVVVRAQVQGEIVEIRVREGDRVRQGDVLAQIDPRDYQNALQRIQATYELAEKDLARQEKLALKQVTAEANLDTMRSHFKEVRAQLEDAHLALDRTRLTAPTDGTVHALPVKQGGYVSRGDAVATLLDIRRVKVAVGIPESDVNALRDLERCRIRIDALGGLEVYGRKLSLAVKPESSSRLYELKLEVANPAGQLLPGMFARVHLVKEVFENTILVPLYAVMNRDGTPFVCTVDGTEAHHRPVETGILSGWQIQITSGLAPGDRVVIAGHRILEEGQTVEVDRVTTDPAELIR